MRQRSSILPTLANSAATGRTTILNLQYRGQPTTSAYNRTENNANEIVKRCEQIWLAAHPDYPANANGAGNSGGIALASDYLHHQTDYHRVVAFNGTRHISRSHR